MREINYQSDFDFILKLYDCSGNEMGIPKYDWEARFYTSSKANAYVASYKDGVYVNCFNDNGQIHIVCNNHGLPSGTLRCEFVAEIPNDIYPDGYEKKVNPQPLEIELVRGACHCVPDMDIQMMLPYIKEQLYSSKDILVEDNFLTLTSPAKRYVFDELWRYMAGEWGTVDYSHTEDDGSERPYYLNELWLTYEEAAAIMSAGRITNSNAQYLYAYSTIRTNLPPTVGAYPFTSTMPKSFINGIIHNSKIEVLNLTTRGYQICMGSPLAEGDEAVFDHIPNLRKIIGVINLGVIPGNLALKFIRNAPKLEDIQIKYLWGHINLVGVPNISAASLKYMIENRHNSNAITITLHADAYNKIIVAESAGDNAEDLTKVSEWSGLVELAASKNVTSHVPDNNL